MTCIHFFNDMNWLHFLKQVCDVLIENDSTADHEDVDVAGVANESCDNIGGISMVHCDHSYAKTVVSKNYNS